MLAIRSFVLTQSWLGRQSKASVFSVCYTRVFPSNTEVVSAEVLDTKFLSHQLVNVIEGLFNGALHNCQKNFTTVGCTVLLVEELFKAFTNVHMLPLKGQFFN